MTAAVSFEGFDSKVTASVWSSITAEADHKFCKTKSLGKPDNDNFAGRLERKLGAVNSRR